MRVSQITHAHPHTFSATAQGHTFDLWQVMAKKPTEPTERRWSETVQPHPLFSLNLKIDPVFPSTELLFKNRWTYMTEGFILLHVHVPKLTKIAVHERANIIMRSNSSATEGSVQRRFSSV